MNAFSRLPMVLFAPSAAFVQGAFGQALSKLATALGPLPDLTDQRMALGVVLVTDGEGDRA